MRRGEVLANLQLKQAMRERQSVPETVLRDGHDKRLHHGVRDKLAGL